MYRLDINDRQHTLLSNVLVLAVEQYRKNVEECRRGAEDLRKRAESEPEILERCLVTPEGFDRLASQFEEQIKDAEVLMDLVDEAEFV